MIIDHMVAVLAAGCLIVGCSTDSPDAAADAGGEPVEMSDPHAVDILRACDAPMPCAGSSAQEAEGFIFYIDTERFECLMQRLAARTPGRYEHSTNITTSTSTTTSHVLVVGVDGSVRYATSIYTSGPTSEQHSETFQPGKQCVLQPASFFEACALALADHNGRRDSAAWQCAYANIEGWFEGCELAPILSCE